MYCVEQGCFNPGKFRVVNGEEVPICSTCYYKKTKPSNNPKITVEFCCWIQDTDVFSVFVDHLNKGLDLKKLNINKPLVKDKPLTKKAGA